MPSVSVALIWYIRSTYECMRLVAYASLKATDACGLKVSVALTWYTRSTCYYMRP